MQSYHYNSQIQIRNCTLVIWGSEIYDNKNINLPMGLYWILWNVVQCQIKTLLQNGVECDLRQRYEILSCRVLSESYTYMYNNVLSVFSNFHLPMLYLWLKMQKLILHCIAYAVDVVHVPLTIKNPWLVPLLFSLWWLKPFTINLSSLDCLVKPSVVKCITSAGSELTVQLQWIQVLSPSSLSNYSLWVVIPCK